jgi:hypothetical protein
MNVFILTAGQCGSRVVVQAFKGLGFDTPDADKNNLDNRPIGKEATPDFRNIELPPEHMDFVLEYVGPYDHSVFKSGPLLRYWKHLDGLLVGAYRHPSLWKQATLAKGKKRNFHWWDDFHAEMLKAHLITGMPLIDFSDGFEDDMTRHFGDCLQHFDKSKINQDEIMKIPPDSSMRIYRGLSECRKSMESITLTQSMLPTLSVGTD